MKDAICPGRDLPHRLLLVVAASLAIAAVSAGAAPIVPGAPTTGWTPNAYPTLLPDYSDGQQGTKAFRVRIGADGNPAGLSEFAGMELDANLDADLDLFLTMESSGTPDRIAIQELHFVTAASDPTAMNFDGDGDGNTDHFLTFGIPFAEVIAALANQSMTDIARDSTLR